MINLQYLGVGIPLCSRMFEWLLFISKTIADEYFISWEGVRYKYIVVVPFCPVHPQFTFMCFTLYFYTNKNAKILNIKGMVFTWFRNDNWGISLYFTKTFSQRINLNVLDCDETSSSKFIFYTKCCQYSKFNEERQALNIWYSKANYCFTLRYRRFRNEGEF